MLCLVILVSVGAYWAGSRIGDSKCRMQAANLSNQTTLAIQNEITETKVKINAEIFNTGMSDIRQQLRKYWNQGLA